jgi:hypothetical protein
MIPMPQSIANSLKPYFSEEKSSWTVRFLPFPAYDDAVKVDNAGRRILKQ